MRLDLKPLTRRARRAMRTIRTVGTAVAVCAGGAINAIAVMGLAGGLVVLALAVWSSVMATTVMASASTPASTPPSAAGSAKNTAPTFNKDVAPILYGHCATCHRPGEIAPFSLLTYEDARQRARKIAGMAAKHEMPPWKAEPGYGEFANERRLSPAEITTLGEWARSGAPEGDPKDKPALPTFPEGWQGGTPDKVLTVDGSYTIAGDGSDQYRCFVLPINNDREMHLVNVEFRPGNPKIVHHAILFLDTSGTARRLDAATPEPGYSCFGGPGFLPGGMLAGWAPGAMPTPRIEGVAKTIPKGTDVVVQIHYHPCGHDEHDSSSIGLTFASTPPTRGESGIVLRSRSIDIPPGDAHYVVKAAVTVPRDVELVGITPHAHYLCRDMKINADLPDGTHVPLIWIKDWDFNWQGTYAYKSPIHLPRGTRVSFEYTYDNSADNPHNPSDPPVRVTWGEQTHDEMALAFLRVLLPTPADEAGFRKEMRREYVKGFMTSMLGPLEP
jgi:mono/diheme cytochrome c family protein